MRTIKLFGILALILGMMSMGNQAQAQSTSYIFDAGDGSGGAIKVIEDAYGITNIHLWQKNTQQWASASIESIDDQGDYTYLRVKSTATNRMYEVYVYWYEDKLYFSLPEGDEKTYWLRKS